MARGACLAGLLLVLAGGCEGGGSPRERARARPAQVETLEAVAPARANVPALINGEPVTWNALRGPLAEAAGRLVLEEVALDRLLAQEMADRGLALAPADLLAEREILMGAVDPTGERSRDERLQLLEALRTRRGLGELRLESLLRRSAMLRRLVADKVTVDDNMIRQRHETRYGPRYVVRAIVFPTEVDAAQARRELMRPLPPDGLVAPPDEPDDGGDNEDAGSGAQPAAAADLRARFIDMAIERSGDITGARGGLLEPISPADPTYPPALRNILPELERGQVSPPVTVDRAFDRLGFALLLLEGVIEPRPVPLETVREEIAAELRLRQERILMGELARRLLNSADIRPLDPGLRWSWEARE